ncbi:50S ribosomal protein L32 [bacterium]|nr:50S ribosomal protein L32 [bacterium]
MAEPKKRKSHTASRLRRGKQNFVLPQLVECTHCHELIPPHQVCPNCGYFKNKKVLELETKVKTKIKDAEQTPSQD